MQPRPSIRLSIDLDPAVFKALAKASFIGELSKRTFVTQAIISALEKAGHFVLDDSLEVPKLKLRRRAKS